MPSRTAYSWPQWPQTSLPSISCVSRRRECSCLSISSLDWRSSADGGWSGRAGKPSWGIVSEGFGMRDGCVYVCVGVYVYGE